jgi:hypothetical protein
MRALIHFPARKFFGVVMGSLAGLFAVAFLGYSLVAGEGIPDGVIALIGTLTGGFGGYMWSSSYEATRRHGGDGDA